jgi:integrase
MLSARTIRNYQIAAKSYFEYCDVEIVDSKYKKRVRLPPIYKEDAEAIDANDIREILNHCDNKRLKAYLLVLASGGLRAAEALAIREKDIDWSGINFAEPTPTDKLKAACVHVRKEFSKTKVARNIYISNEAARYLNEWLEWKYRLQGTGSRMAGKDDLIFARVRQKGHHSGLYNKMAVQFKRALIKAGYGSRKEEGVYKRRNITFHSFRRFAKTTIVNRARNSDCSEWFLGDAKSTYYTNKAAQLREIYEQDCMQFLTFLDFKSMEEIGKDIRSELNAQIEQLRRENEELREKNHLE